jgi:hypothetical protein
MQGFVWLLSFAKLKWNLFQWLYTDGLELHVAFAQRQYTSHKAIYGTGGDTVLFTTVVQHVVIGNAWNK